MNPVALIVAAGGHGAGGALIYRVNSINGLCDHDGGESRDDCDSNIMKQMNEQDEVEVLIMIMIIITVHMMEMKKKIQQKKKKTKNKKQEMQRIVITISTIRNFLNSYLVHLAVVVLDLIHNRVVDV